MGDWDFTPPPPSELGDHDVPREGEHLAGRRVALLVTGGIAALKAPLVARALRRQGAEVVAFASGEGLRYVTAESLEWATLHPVVTRLTPAAEHLSDDRPFDAYLVAPATYNTLNKVAAGIADTAVTTAIASALGRIGRGETAVLVAPTMHGSLHNPILSESLRRLERLGVRIVPPREDYGKHNLPDEEVLVAEVCRAVSRSPLAGVGVLVTAGPTPVPVDSVRRITNRFRGRLGAEVARELHLRGARALLVLGDGGFQPPAWLPVRPVATFDDYRDAVLAELAAGAYSAAVFSAAVADYRPRQVRSGKTPSGGALSHLELVPTEKVVDLVRERFPDLHMVTFKYQEGVSHEDLMAVGRERLARLGGRGSVVANRGEETGPAGEQVAWLLGPDGEPRRAVGKPAIAALLAGHLEALAAAGAFAPARDAAAQRVPAPGD
jgi:phosphopantothenoylcysteine decarboxylase/phosphopantothenate--cysteine ligase